MKKINFDEPYIIINIPVRAMILKTIFKINHKNITKNEQDQIINAMSFYFNIFIEIYPEGTKKKKGYDWCWDSMKNFKLENYIDLEERKYFIKDNKINKNRLIDCMDFLKYKKVSTIDLLKNYKEN